MKYFCHHCQKGYTEADLNGSLPICTCGDDLLQVSEWSNIEDIGIAETQGDVGLAKAAFHAGMQHAAEIARNFENNMRTRETQGDFDFITGSIAEEILLKAEESFVRRGLKLMEKQLGFTTAGRTPPV